MVSQKNALSAWNSLNLNGLVNQRFARNFFPMPATNDMTMGAVVPPFKLLDVTNDRQVKLSTYQGKCPVVLEFTRIFTENLTCPLCSPHIKALNDHYEEFVSRGAALLMIASTDERQSRKVVENFGLAMPLLVDPSCRVFRAYQVGQALGAPLSAQFILDRRGKLCFKHLFSFLEPNASVDQLLEIVDAL